MTTDEDTVLLSGMAETNILLLRINRPAARNALSTQIFAQLHQQLAAAASDPSIRVVILTGAGKNFAAGSDINEFAAHDAVSIQLDEREAIWQAITNFPKPLIGAIAGFCFGGGCELAMHCDILIADTTAKFAQPEINIGIMPGAGGTQRLPRAVGKSLAMQMALTGEAIDAPRALLAGLVSEVVEPDQLQARAMAIAKAIAAKSPLGVRYTKQALLGAFDQSLRDGLLLERRFFQLLFSTADRQEGLAAFREKRKPEFSGK